MHRFFLTLLVLLCAVVFSSIIGQKGGGAARSNSPLKTPPLFPTVSSARTLIKDGKYSEAEKLLQDAFLSAAPESPEEKEIKKILQINLARRVAAQMAEARTLICMKKYDEAEAQLREAISDVPEDLAGKKEATTLLDELLDTRRQYAQIEQAKRLISGGDFIAASTIIKDVLDKAKNGEVINDAARVDAEIHQKSEAPWRKLFDHYTATLWLILDIISGLLGFLALLFILRWVYSRTQRKEWMLFPIEDKTGLGASDVVVESLGRWTAPNAPISAGLLKLEMLQFASIPKLEGMDQSLEMDLAPAIAALPLKVGGVELTGLAQVLVPFRRWMNATRPWIKGTVLATETLITVRLTMRDADGKTTSVTSSAEKGHSIEAAESASYKMYYLIANRTTVEEAGAANYLRSGLSLLKQYVHNRTPEKLTEAYKAFRNARNEGPAFEEAYLYEGIALDLMEKHDEAIKRFHFLSQEENTPDNKDLREKAKCNEAIARFRKYKAEEIKKAIDILDSVIGSDVTNEVLAASQIKAMALATKANAIAHKPIFWQEFLFPVGPPSTDPSEVKERKRHKATEIRGWVDEVMIIAKTLEAVKKQVGVSEPKWDDLTVRQLRWAIENAIGNAYLNYAKNILGQPVSQQVENPELRNQDLEKSYAAFQNCEMLLPSGVETLTNLATVLSELGREAEARHYLQEAVDLNNEYEYAYYRMAQSWEKQNNTNEVIRVLKEFAKIKAASIPSFQTIYSKYATELAQS